MILDDLTEEGWTAERFASACRKHRKLSSFLPTTADLLAADKALAEATTYWEMQALPAWDTPEDEQAAKNQTRARDLLAALSGGKRPEWAKRAQ